MSRETSVQGSGGGATRELFLLVDIETNRDHPELSYLLSFDAVAGLEMARLEGLSDTDADIPVAILRSGTSTTHAGVRPLGQFQRFAGDLVARADPTVSEPALVRAMALALLARRMGADGVVSPTFSAFADEPGLLSDQRMFTVDEALAVVGACVRLRPMVPLAGEPSLHWSRADVYWKTVGVLTPSAPEWWAACVTSFSATDPNLGLAQTTLKRVAQSLRGRDSVHEGLRRLQGVTAVEEALYHLDVVLTSSVAAFDALARLANNLFSVGEPQRRSGWQKDAWIRKLGEQEPQLAALMGSEEPAGRKLRFITRLRNGIHGIAPSEALHVDTATNSVEHRVSIPEDLAENVEGLLTDDMGTPAEHGVFLADRRPVVNPGVLVERVVVWTIEILDVLMSAMLEVGRPSRAESVVVTDDGEEVDRALAVLAGVGAYPTTSGRGFTASSTTRRRVLGALARARQQLGPQA